MPRFGRRVVFTRFVPPRAVEGSWAAYYQRWEFAAASANAEQLQLVPPWRGSERVARACSYESNLTMKARAIGSPSFVAMRAGPAMIFAP